MLNKMKIKKAGFILPVALAFVFMSSAQNLLALATAEAGVNETAPQQSQNDVIFEVVDKNPQFPGEGNAQANLMRFLSENIQYPEEAKQKGEQGRVVVQYIVRATGEITDVKVVRGVSPLLDAEAIRIVKAMPKWIPGEMRGQAVSVHYTLPIVFRLH
jgi:TonB family protein